MQRLSKGNLGALPKSSRSLHLTFLIRHHRIIHQRLPGALRGPGIPTQTSRLLQFGNQSKSIRFAHDIAELLNGPLSVQESIREPPPHDTRNHRNANDTNSSKSLYTKRRSSRSPNISQNPQLQGHQNHTRRHMKQKTEIALRQYRSQTCCRTKLPYWQIVLFPSPIMIPNNLKCPQDPMGNQ